MNTLVMTEEFDAWMHALRDRAAKARITARIIRAEHGNFGDCEPVGGGISEMRIHTGPGYRVYLTRRAEVVYLLLCAGSKGTQQADICRAASILESIKEVPTHDQT